VSLIAFVSLQFLTHFTKDRKKERKKAISPSLHNFWGVCFRDWEAQEGQGKGWEDM
jgi:hypothetical protein